MYPSLGISSFSQLASCFLLKVKMKRNQCYILRNYFNRHQHAKWKRLRKFTEAHILRKKITFRNITQPWSSVLKTLTNGEDTAPSRIT